MIHLGVKHFLSALADKVTGIFIPNQLLEDILTLKVAIILIAVSLLITSTTLLFLTISHRKFKKSFKILESNSSPAILLKMPDPEPEFSIKRQSQTERR